jgi:hypothetical protein
MAVATWRGFAGGRGPRWRGGWPLAFGRGVAPIAAFAPVAPFSVLPCWPAFGRPAPPRPRPPRRRRRGFGGPPAGELAAPATAGVLTFSAAGAGRVSPICGFGRIGRADSVFGAPSRLFSTRGSRGVSPPGDALGPTGARSGLGSDIEGFPSRTHGNFPCEGRLARRAIDQMIERAPAAGAVVSGSTAEFMPSGHKGRHGTGRGDTRGEHGRASADRREGGTR